MKTNQTKACNICGGYFSREKSLSYERWDMRKSCSMKCRNATLSLQKKGKIPDVAGWNKGKGRKITCKGCKIEFQARVELNGVKTTYCTRECYLKHYRVWNKGKPYLQLRGENHHNWKGGITDENRKIRTSIEYKNWRISVFERDDYTCQVCKIRGGTLNADHIKPFCLYPDLRLSLENGRTLCKDCHDIHGWKSRKNQYSDNNTVFGAEITDD